jgi:hypothetical protein
LPTTDIRRRSLLTAVVLALAALAAVSLPAVAGARTVSYRGYAVKVPAGWPVFRLTADSRTCVRFDRHAVYLGTPSTTQRCPTDPLGRTEAILVSPQQPTSDASIASSGASLLRPRQAPGDRQRGSSMLETTW